MSVGLRTCHGFVRGCRIIPWFPGLRGDWHQVRQNCFCVNSITQVQKKQTEPEGRKGAARSPWEEDGNLQLGKRG